jgi:hexosaminidase
MENGDADQSDSLLHRVRARRTSRARHLVAVGAVLFLAVVFLHERSGEEEELELDVGSEQALGAPQTRAGAAGDRGQQARVVACRCSLEQTRRYLRDVPFDQFRPVQVSQLLWPSPHNVSFSPSAGASASNVTLRLSPSLRLQAVAATPMRSSAESTLARAFERLCGGGLLWFAKAPRRQAEARGQSSLAVISALRIEMLSDANHAAESPLVDDESYALHIDAPTSTISSATLVGALRGIETFAQLFDSAAPLLHVALPARTALPLNVLDRPHFRWRGLLLDTSRHFFPTHDVARLLRGMSASKMNVLHMHLTDAQAFPLELHGQRVESNVRAAWSNRKRYSAADLRYVVAYAADLGITVVPELDVPAHTASWARAFPKANLLAKCPKHVQQASTAHGGGSINVVALNPASNSTFTLLEAVLGTIADIFPCKYLHVGGDEVNFECWEEDAGVHAWMRSHGYQRRDALQAFEDRVMAILGRRNRTAIVWQGTPDEGVQLPKSKAGLLGTAIVEPWKAWAGLSRRAMQQALSQGHPVLQTAGWYLDWQSTWQDFYHNDPLFSPGTTQRQARKFLWGGEACMWSERVNPLNLDCRVWPRAAAVAERLWSRPPAWLRAVSGSSKRDAAGKMSFTPAAARMASKRQITQRVHARLLLHRERLVARGIAAAQLDDMGTEVNARGQCPPIDERSQRPLNAQVPFRQQPRAPQVPGKHCARVPYGTPLGRSRWQFRPAAIVSLNADDGLGAGDDGARQHEFFSWLRTQPEVGVVGLVELNHWDVPIKKQNRGKELGMASRAAEAGFPFSSLFRPPKHPYWLGLFSAFPIVAVDKQWKGFERGMVHAQVQVGPAGQDVIEHYFVVHLDAHDAVAREREAQRVAEAVRAASSAGAPVLVMGDFNTLSPLDRPLHEAMGLLDYFQSHAHNPHFRRMKRKFVVDGHLSYRPMQILLNEKLVDLCYPDGSNAPSSPNPQCRYSEPTRRRPDIPEVRLHARASQCWSRALTTHLASPAHCFAPRCRQEREHPKFALILCWPIVRSWNEGEACVRSSSKLRRPKRCRITSH